MSNTPNEPLELEDHVEENVDIYEDAPQISEAPWTQTVDQRQDDES